MAFKYFLLCVMNYIVVSQFLSHNKEYDIFSFGMPILDYIIEEEMSPDVAQIIRTRLNYHEKTSDTAKEILQSLMEKDANSVFKILGGSALNTVRLFHHANNNTNDSFIGCIGNDKDGFLIKDLLNNERLDNELIVSENNKSTSMSIVLLKTNKDKITFASLDSSAELKLKYFLTDKVQHRLNNSKIFYTDAYLINDLYEVYKYIGENYGQDNDMLLGIGLGQKELIYDQQEKFRSILPYFDVLFMNKGEFKTLKKTYNFTDKIPDSKNNITFDDFFNYFSNFKSNKNKDLILVVTQGKGDVIVLHKSYKNNTIEKINEPIIFIPSNWERDYTAAGDSFAGGFLSGLYQGKTLSESAILGNIMATEVIQKKGFQIPVISEERILEEMRIQKEVKFKKRDL